MSTAMKTMKTMSATEHVDTVRNVAESIKSDETQYFPIAASSGDRHRQGDIYITLLKGLPDNTVKVEKPPMQLAPGNTQGSRHCLRSLEGVTMYTLKSPTVYDGPILQLAVENEIMHPEHADVVFPPGCYAISYQRTEDSEGVQRRVQD